MFNFGVFGYMVVGLWGKFIGDGDVRVGNDRIIKIILKNIVFYGVFVCL